MPASSLQAYSAQVAKAFGLNGQGGLIDGRWCLNSPHGPVCLSAYDGDPLLLDWLGPWLEDAQGVTGRLSISRLLPATSGHYYTTINGQTVILQGFAAGPPCDVHNSFELYSVSAGVAWVHQLSLSKVSGSPADWGKELQQLRTAAQHLNRPKLPRRVQPVWELLMETWQLCLDQASTRSKVMQHKSESSLLLGIDQFQDFIYVADRHVVHYNSTARCYAGLPALELARLLRACEYNLQTAEAMLLSYQRVRSLSDAEKQQLLAFLWSPWEVTVEQLTAPGLTVMAINRLRRLVEQKVAWVTELGELLLPDLDDEIGDTVDLVEGPVHQVQLSKQQTSGDKKAELDKRVCNQDGDTLSTEKEGPSLPEKKAAQQKANAPKEQVEQPVKAHETTPMQPEAAVAEAPGIQMQSIPERKVLVWKAFPRPLGAPPEEPKVEMEQDVEATIEQEYEETEAPGMTEVTAGEAAPPVDDSDEEDDLEP